MYAAVGGYLDPLLLIISGGEGDNGSRMMLFDEILTEMLLSEVPRYRIKRASITRSLC